MNAVIEDQQAQNDKFFLEEVLRVAQESTCNRAHVGAIIARGGYILSTGVNTAPPGLPTCEDEGHLMIEGHCCRTIHAEANAIYTALEMFSLDNATLYITHQPCVHCRNLIIQSGIKRVIYLTLYRSIDIGQQISGNVEWIHYNGV